MRKQTRRQTNGQPGHIRRSRSLLGGVLGLFAALVGFVPMAGAIVPAATPCDPNYYDALESRAWLEAQREITQNQNLIYKPDSVLEYTCFNQHLLVLASAADGMLSDNTTRWGAVPGISNANLDNALNLLIGSALTNYLTNNFAHTFLGGRGGIAGAAGGPGGYNCDLMNQVWNIAKCENFMSSAATDGFYTFAEYLNAANAGTDIRYYPSMCTGVAALAGRLKTEIEAVTIAKPWPADTPQTFMDRLDPANCTTATPIETGIRVSRQKQAPTDFDEKVCIMPGCHYNPATNKCEGS